MLHPSYSELMEKINSEAEEQETVVNSRYSIVIATAKRARQIIDGDMPLVESEEEIKPLSAAVKELDAQKIQILPDNSEEE